MSDKPMESAQPQPLPRGKANDKHLHSGPAPLDLRGGEPLEGSGFESEVPEPDSQWRDPR